MHLIAVIGIIRLVVVDLLQYTESVSRASGNDHALEEPLYANGHSREGEGSTWAISLHDERGLRRAPPARSYVRTNSGRTRSI